MNELLNVTAEQVLPDVAAVLAGQGVPPGTGVAEDVSAAGKTSLELLKKHAVPAGIVRPVARDVFAEIYRGEGRNEPHTPVGDIFPRGENLALFAVTLGDRVGQIIKELFGSNDFALGAMLDSAASVAADRLAELAERYFADALAGAGKLAPGSAVLRYSPGYCGWHITGQEKLFEHLEPGKIGVSLNESHLMQPLKSVSGVIISGPAEIHDFCNTYPLCGACKTGECRRRIRGLLAK